MVLAFKKQFVAKIQAGIKKHAYRRFVRVFVSRRKRAINLIVRRLFSFRNIQMGY